MAVPLDAVVVLDVSTAFVPVPEAVGALAQIELNVTVRGDVGATPLTSTVTVTLVVP